MDPRTVPAQQDRCRGNTLLLRDLDNRLRREERASRATEGAVRGDVDALGLAEVDDLLLRQGGVVLDLVDCGDDGGLGEELLEVANAVVGDADSLGLASGEELLHALPGGDVGVGVDDVAGAVGVLGEHGVVAFTLLALLHRSSPFCKFP